MESQVGGPSPGRGSLRTAAGVVLLGLGALLLAAAAAYYVYGAVADARLDQLAYSADRPSRPHDLPARRALTGPSTAHDGSERYALGAEAAARLDATAPREESGPTSQLGAKAVPAFSEDILSGLLDAGEGSPSAAGVQTPWVKRGVTPVGGPEGRTLRLGLAGFLGSGRGAAAQGTADDAGQPSEPSVTGTAENSGSSLAAPALGDSRQSGSPSMLLSPSEVGAIRAEANRQMETNSAFAFGPFLATRISIPAIEVDSEVRDLEVVRLAESRSWETPNKIVGHIPTTAAPGALGEGWYFGHLESPIRGEGKVFNRLPEIPGLLRKGQDVHIYLRADGIEYVYRVYKTEALGADELRITDSGFRDITLVTCYPKFHYDKRLLVTAALVGASRS